MNITILGAGAWGAALAISLSRQHVVCLWARNPHRAAEMAASRRTPYLADVPIPESVTVTADVATALAGTDLALITAPIAGLRDTLVHVRDFAAGAPVIWGSKGFEMTSGYLPHEVATAVLGERARCAALSGPSFALEVAHGLPTALTLASTDAAFARATAKRLHQRNLRVYFSDDLVGVEVGGAVKNVMAIATGIAEALGLGLNARAALITRGLAEVTRLGVRLGGHPETFMGLAGVGDLILTCTGDLSRNRRVGLALGRGERLEAILAGLGHVAEGVDTAREVESRAEHAGVDMPITRAVCDVLFRGVTPRDAVEQLLDRDPKSET